MPGALDNAIVVAAVDASDRKACFSNYGDAVDVAAPGVGILSCVPGGSYRSLDGTSMAAPYVAAVAAMYRLKYPLKTPAQIEEMVKENVRDLGNAGWDQYFGFGIPDLSSVSSVEPAGIVLDQSSITMEEGDTVTLTVTVSPDNAADKTVKWRSSDQSVATVDDGRVTGISEGSAVIIASTVNGKEAICRVMVTAGEVQPEGITLDKGSMTVEEGDTVILTATVSPDNAADKTVEWRSSDQSVATVDDGRVTGVSEGSVIIIASTVNGKEAICRVTVTVGEVQPEGITSDKSSMTMEEGDMVILTATVSPDNAADKTVEWRSSDQSVATVDDGRVTGISEGSVTIIASTVNGKATTCQVRVIPKDKLTLNYSAITLYANENGSISLFNKGGGQTIGVKVGESVQAGINVNFYYSHVPGLQLKAYLNGKEIPASQVVWSLGKNSGYCMVDENGYVSGSTNGGFVTMSPFPVRSEQTITATLKSNPSVSAKVELELVYDAKIKFSVTDTNVASVDENGIITGKSAGATELIMESELTGRKATCSVSVGNPVSIDSELVYKVNNQYYTLDCYGNQNYVPVSSKYDFYLKVPLDNEICEGSRLELSVKYNANSYDPGTVRWSDGFTCKDGYCYYPISSKLYYQSGKIQLYYQIILANGLLLHPVDQGSTNCYYLNVK